MVYIGGSYRAGVVTAAFAVGAAAGASADVVDEILERERHLSKLHVEFEWRAARAPIRANPYEDRWWTEAELPMWRCQQVIRILRPWFAMDSRCYSGYGRQTWVDGILTQVNRESDQPDDQPWGVYITPDIWPVHGGQPWLTPLEMQSFDADESYFDLLRSGELRLAEQTAERVVLSGTMESRPGQEGQPGRSPWELRLELDPRRGYLPLEYHARLPVGRAGTLEWTMRTLDSVAVGPVHVVREAIIVLRPGRPLDRDGWMLYRFTASSIRHDPTIDRAAVSPRLPTENFGLVDRTTGLRRHVDAQGRVIFEQQQTPEELRRDEELFQRRVVASALARQELPRRQTYFIVLTVAALLATAAAVAIVWRRRMRPA